MRGVRLVAVCLVGLSTGNLAFADTIAVVQPTQPSSSMAETLARLRGELLSIGFEVMLIEGQAEAPAATRPSEAWKQRLAQHAEVEAALVLVGQEAPLAVDVWIANRAHHFERTARVALESSADNSPKRLAIRAIEVLRAGLLESRLSSTERPAPAAPTPAPAAPTSATVRDRAPAQLAPSERRLGLELGLATLVSTNQVGPALLPVLRADWAMLPNWVLHATFAGFGPSSSVEASAGSARLDMHYAHVGLSLRVPPERWLKSFGALSAGVFRTHVQGTAPVPFREHSANQWSFLLDASAGAILELSPRYFLTAAVHAQLTEPYVAIHIGDQTAASLGRPNLLAVVTLGVWP